VEAGRGWTVIVRSRAVVPPPGTAVVQLEGMDVGLDIAAVWRRDERRLVMRTVLETIYDVARSYPESAVRANPQVPTPPPGRKRRSRTPRAVPAALEVRHLRALLAVAATQTIGRGAERLGITQPTLSRQLQELEHAAGLTLLERSARGVRLTAAGASLAGDVPPVLLAVERMVQAIVRAKRGMEGRCVIGMVATNLTTEMIGRTVAECTARHPHIQVLISELATFRQPAALTRGEIDLGLAHVFPGTYPADGLTHTRVIDDRLNVALLPADHPLTKRKRLKATDLADLPFLFMARSFSPPFYDALYGALARLGLKPRVDAEYEALHAVWALTAQGKGWSIGWESLRRTPPAGTVACVITGLRLPFGIDLLRRIVEHNPTVDVVAQVLLNQRGRKRSY
jgi:DNA-binding transcriptional LysR family regulator